MEQRADVPVTPSPEMTDSRDPVDPKAWLDEHGDALFRYALLHVGDRERAEDLVQDTLLAAWQARKRFERRSSERTWMIGILRHKIIDHLRRTRRELDVELDETVDYVVEHFTAAGRWKSSMKKWGPSPAKALEKQEFWDVLAFCMARLPQQMLFAFTEREMLGRKTEEICKVLRTTATNLWTILHRARTRLRKCLEANWVEAGS
jgi:RNA polymerase sigma-70 factor (ECF subfamily)